MRFSTAGLILFPALTLFIGSDSLNIASAAPIKGTSNAVRTVRPRIRRLHGISPYSSLRYRRAERRSSPDVDTTEHGNSEGLVPLFDAAQSIIDSTTAQEGVPSAISDEMHPQNAHIFDDSEAKAHAVTLPVVAVSPGRTYVVRRGRTSEGSGRSRPINPIVVTEAASNGTNIVDGTDIIHFTIANATRGLTRRGSIYNNGTLSDQIATWANMTQISNIMKAANLTDMFADVSVTVKAKNGNASAPASWSKFRSSTYNPSVPYQPSPNTTGYGDVLSKNFCFYQVQRSGALQQSPRSISWRNDSALTDGSDNNVDLSGGYYDAGDYLKFTHPLSYALTMLAYGSLDYGSALNKSANLGYADETLRWGLDWLIKAHANNDTLYVQVGDGDVDNNYWGGDQTIPTPRPSFAVNRQKPGTDVTAGTAAAFAAGALFYSTVIPDTAYAHTLLSHALSLFYLAESAPRRLYQNSVPAVKEWYASTDYSDELCLAALLLHRSTGNIYFMKRAEAYFKKYKIADNADPLDWDSKHGLCMMVGAQLVQEYGVASSVQWRSAFEGYLNEVTQAADRTKGGMLWWDGSSDTDSLSHAMSVTYLLDQYTRMFPSTSKSVEYRQIADDQIDYVFGKNPKQMTYVVGINDKSPKNPQSAMASGGNDIGKVDTSPKVMMRTLYGAMVGGPGKDDSYEDRRSNWKQSECALDYNAALTPVLLSEMQRGRTPYFMR